MHSLSAELLMEVMVNLLCTGCTPSTEFLFLLKESHHSILPLQVVFHTLISLRLFPVKLYLPEPIPHSLGVTSFLRFNTFLETSPK